MTANALVVALLLLTLILAAYAVAADPAEPPAATDRHARSLSDPFTHENLTVFIVRGEEAAKGQRFLTLKEALEQKKIQVHETGTVNELAVENLSDEQIFIQAGDIVRGGKQDRLIAIDFIVEPKSGRITIQSFCVESGRWQKRGGESDREFASSLYMAPSNAVKLAAKSGGNQSAVWSGVAEDQRRLCANLGASVAAPASPSSLQLTLENRAVQSKREAYVKALAHALDGKADAIGVVVAINGRSYSADVYGTSDLFRKLWPKLLDAAAVEAIASQSSAKDAPKPTPDAAQVFIATADQARLDETAISPRLKLIRRETDELAQFDTLDQKAAGAALHRNCLRKESRPAGPDTPVR